MSIIRESPGEQEIGNKKGEKRSTSGCTTGISGITETLDFTACHMAQSDNIKH